MQFFDLVFDAHVSFFALGLVAGAVLGITAAKPRPQKKQQGEYTVVVVPPKDD